mgnify:CR=1 FL=1
MQNLSIVLDKSFDFRYIIFALASYPSGKGLVCKTIIERFDSARRLAKYESLFAAHFFAFRAFLAKLGLVYYIWGVMPLFLLYLDSSKIIFCVGKFYITEIFCI